MCYFWLVVQYGEIRAISVVEAKIRIHGHSRSFESESGFIGQVSLHKQGI